MGKGWMCAWRQVPLMVLHRLLAAFVVDTAPGGFRVVSFWRLWGHLGFFYNTNNNLQDSVIQ